MSESQPKKIKAWFASDPLAHFGFHHVEGNKVAVRLGLFDQCNYVVVQVGIFLPLKQGKLQDWITSATSSKKEGIMGRNLQAITKDASTSSDLKRGK